MTRRSLSGALLLGGVMLLPGVGASATLKGWNVRVWTFTTHVEVPAASGAGLWLGEPTKADLFRVGEPVVVLCGYQYTKIGDVKAFQPFTVELLTTGSASYFEEQKVTTYDKFAEPHGIVVGLWVPTTAGQHNLRCNLVTADDDVSDNSADRPVKVVPKSADGMEGAFPAPAPVFAAPASKQKFVLGPTLHVPLKVTIPAVPFAGKPNMAEYAKSTEASEKWHVAIVRAGTGQYSAWEAPVGLFEGTFDSLEFGSTVAKALTARWFSEHGGAGTYRARAYLTQTLQSGTRKSPSATVEFEITAPVPSLSSRSQSRSSAVVATPGPTAVPPSSRTSAPEWGAAPPAKGSVAKSGTPLAPKPDLKADPSLSVGGKPAKWESGSLSVGDHLAKAAAGTCSFPVVHTVRNAGSGPTGPFMSTLKSSPAADGSVSHWASLAPGEGATRESLVNLVPGANELVLTLDPHFAVSESDETNNTSKITVNVAGSCTAATTTPAPASGTARTPPPPGAGGKIRGPVPPVQAPTR